MLYGNRKVCHRNQGADCDLREFPLQANLSVMYTIVTKSSLLVTHCSHLKKKNNFQLVERSLRMLFASKKT